MAARIFYPNVLANAIQKSREAYWVRRRFYCSNPLIPTTLDSSIKDVVAIDCEMVGVRSLSKNRIEKDALAKVTLVNEQGKVVYDEYVRPVGTVVNLRTWVSGIRRGDLQKGIDFNDARKKVAEMIHGKILVGHALHGDLKVLLLNHPKKDIRDTSKYGPYLEGGRRQSLKKLAAKVLDIKIQNGEHCSAVDARAVMMLYQKKKIQWENKIQNAKEAEKDEEVLNAQGKTEKEKKIPYAERKTKKKKEILNAPGEIEKKKKVLNVKEKQKKKEFLDVHGMTKRKGNSECSEGNQKKKKDQNVKEKHSEKCSRKTEEERKL